MVNSCAIPSHLEHVGITQSSIENKIGNVGKVQDFVQHLERGYPNPGTLKGRREKTIIDIKNVS